MAPHSILWHPLFGLTPLIHSYLHHHFYSSLRLFLIACSRFTPFLTPPWWEENPPQLLPTFLPICSHSVRCNKVVNFRLRRVGRRIDAKKQRFYVAAYHLSVQKNLLFWSAWALVPANLCTRGSFWYHGYHGNSWSRFILFLKCPTLSSRCWKPVRF